MSDDTNIEKLILENFILSPQYAKKVLPYLKEEYFSEPYQKLILTKALEFFAKYKQAQPSKDALLVMLEDTKTATQGQYETVIKFLDSMNQIESDKIDWLVDQTELFCKKKAMFNALQESIGIFQGEGDKTQDLGTIQDLVKNALSISFDSSIGHDYLIDAKNRYEKYHDERTRIPFDLEFLNRITKNGVFGKTLNVFMAGPGVGKSLFMCHIAANFMMQGKNVLYITCEMAEEWIGQRIDANLMGATIDEVESMTKKEYAKRLFQATQGVTGKLIIKEYPTSSAHVNHFRHLLDELELKKDFKPDVIFVDYLNICVSSRMKSNGTSTYSMIKAIAEELRGLACEYEVPVFTATQVNRVGYASTDFGMENTAESFGLPATADLFLALITSEELEEKDLILLKQLKNRYNSLAINRKGLIKIDRARMRLADAEENDVATAEIIDDLEQKAVETVGGDFLSKFRNKSRSDWKT